MERTRLVAVAGILLLHVAPLSFFQAFAADLSGELKRWHRVTVTFDGPETSEDDAVNPFLDYRLTVTFTHGATGKVYTVPGFYAADGDAAETGASAGNKWRVHFTPDEEGLWFYAASFRTGDALALSLDPAAGVPTSFDGEAGSFSVAPTDKSAPDFRARGTLRYVGGHHLQFAGTGEYFLKAGSDTPENFLAYQDIDATYKETTGCKGIIHAYEPHLQHWQAGDPTWQGDKGKGIIGAVNYLSSVNVNSQYMLTYNIDGGDGCDVWPWTSPSVRDRFDVSKLAQWEIVFSHMTRKGLQIHLVLAERENKAGLGTELTQERMLYYRELVARFSHHPVLQWNVGEEHNISNSRRIDYAGYIRDLDPYDHPLVIHTTVNGDDPIDFYHPGTGALPSIIDPSVDVYEGSSIQGAIGNFNAWAQTLRDLTATQGARPWAVYFDEPTGASDQTDRRKLGTWGGLMGGGAGIEWFIGGDQDKEDFTRDEELWLETGYAVDFFQQYVPFAETAPSDGLLASGTGHLLSLAGEVYVVYLPEGGSASLDLGGLSGTFDVQWYDPRNGGALQAGSVASVEGGGVRSLGLPPAESTADWAALVRRADDDGAAALTLDLPAGWSLVSSWVVPEAAALEDVFAEILSDVVIVKDEAGRTFIPAFGINEIGAWDPLQAYMLYTSAETSLHLSGTAVRPEETPVPLETGWNYLPYLRSTATAIEGALAGIEPDLVIVKTASGAVYLPEFGINDIGDLEPGQGYKTYVNASTTLVYEANTATASPRASRRDLPSSGLDAAMERK